MKWFILFTALVLNAVANILIKAGMARPDVPGGLIEALKTKWLSLPVISGVLCFGLALAAYSITLKRMPLSIAYPIMTTGGLFIISAVSVIYFKETITTVQMVGLALLVGGIWLVAR